MIDAADSPDDWAKREPYKTLVAAAEIVEAQGYSVQEIAEAFLLIAASMQAAIHGPELVANRLRGLASRYAAEAQDGLPN
jgi:hypothetical protein